MKGDTVYTVPLPHSSLTYWICRFFFIGFAFIGQTLSTKAGITMSLWWQYYFRQPSLMKGGKALLLLFFFPHFCCAHILSLCAHSQGYVYFIMTGSCHNKVPYPPLTIGLVDVLSPPVETYSTLCNWHWKNSSMRISLSIQQHSYYVLFISEQRVSAARYASGSMFSGWTNPPSAILNYPPVHHLVSEIELELSILGLYYSIDSSST